MGIGKDELFHIIFTSNWSLFISRGGEGKEGGVFLKGEHDFGSIRGGISCRLQSINGGLWKIYCQLPGN